MLKEIYRKIVPIGLRYTIANIRFYKRNKRVLAVMKKKYQQGNYPLEYKYEIEYLVKNNKINVFPYEWTEEYKVKEILVYKDVQKKMHYVLHHGKRLYFPKGYSSHFIQCYYLSLIMEQDSRSPHCYFPDGMNFLKDSIFVDIGAAEGIIALDVIEMVKRVVIFECNEEWMSALKETFEPWKEKVTIVPKFVGKCQGKNMINLDSWFLDDSNERYALKVDVEGNEKEVLEGAEKLLKSSITDIFICTYHNKEDYQVLGNMIVPYGFTWKEPHGYMFYGDDIENGFRHGMIRSNKKMRE